MSKIELYNCNCVEYMKTLPNNHFKLAICDPPYGIDVIKMVYKGREGDLSKRKESENVVRATYEIKEWDKEPPKKEYYEQLFRVSENQIIWGANHFTDMLPISRGWIFWDKDNYSDFSDGEIAWTSFDVALKRVLYVWNGMRQGKKVGVQSCKGGNFKQGNKDNLEKRIHPTQKPVKLYEWILENYAKEGDNIFDSHLGSASSVLACYNLGFDITGCELDKDYFEAANKRIDTHIAQCSMLIPQPEKKVILPQANELF